MRTVRAVNKGLTAGLDGVDIGKLNHILSERMLNKKTALGKALDGFTNDMETNLRHDVSPFLGGTELNPLTNSEFLKEINDGPIR